MKDKKKKKKIIQWEEKRLKQSQRDCFTIDTWNLKKSYIDNCTDKEEKKKKKWMYI